MFDIIFFQNKATQNKKEKAKKAKKPTSSIIKGGGGIEKKRKDLGLDPSRVDEEREGRGADRAGNTRQDLGSATIVEDGGRAGKSRVVKQSNSAKKRRR